jgi:stringent starvation protein B
MTSEHHATKRALLEQLLEQSMVMVTVDARMRGVVVPDHLVADPQLRLNLSYRFGLPMQLDDAGIRATLTFGGVPFPCRLPWESIYVVVPHSSGEPYFFPGDAPVGLFDGADATPAAAPQFEVIPGEPVEAGEPERTPPKRGHLRVVK